MLGPRERQIVLQSIRNVCQHSGWALLAAHVRATHVHVVVDAETTPERIMNALKSYATRALSRKQRTWARHGSTRHLWTPSQISNAVRYVLSKQGEAMAVYSGVSPP
jgi:REP element-mobilizing transposase RayT